MDIGPWGEVIGVVALACVGAGAGYLCSRLPKPYWALGALVPFVPLFIMDMDLFQRTMPFSWLAFCRRENAAAAPLVTMMFFTIIPHLRTRGEKALTVLLVLLVEIQFSVFPFLRPALAQGYFQRLECGIDADGVCRQSTGYTCVPAATVTALHRMGIEATQGDIAILARMRRHVGARFQPLQVNLERRYRQEGLKCTEMRFGSLDELREAGITLVSSKEDPAGGHCVVVFEVTDTEVVIGDPRRGLRRMSYEYFMKIWDNWGIVLSRQPPNRAANPP